MASADLDQLIGQEAFKQADLMNEKLDLMIKNTEKLVASAKTITDAFGKSGGSGLGKQVQEVEDLANNNKKLTSSLKELTLEEAKLKEAIRQKNAEMKLAAKEALANAGSHDQLDAQLQKEILTLRKIKEAVGNQTAEYKNQQATVQKLYTEVAKLDAAQGKFSKNVGNYTNQTFQLSQVIREIPAFMYSAQTGILALSNNLPMLGDAVKNVAGQLGADGKPNGLIGALKIFGASLFSLPNLFAIAVGLFTIYSKEIIAAFKGTSELSKEMKELSKSLGDAEGKIRTSISILNNKNLSHQEHLKVAKELKELYPVTLKNYSLEEIAAGKAAGAIDGLRVSIVNMAKAKAVQADLEKNAGRQYEIEELRATALQKIIQLQKQESDQKKVLASQTAGSERYDAQKAILDAISTRLRDEKDNVIALTTEYKQIDTVINGLASKISNLTANTTDERVGKQGKTKTEKTDKVKHDMEQGFELMKRNFDVLQDDINAKIFKSAVDTYVRLFQWLQEHPNKVTIKWDWKDSLQAFAQSAVPIIEDVQKVSNNLAETALNISDIATAKELANLETKTKALNQYYSDELRFIEQSGFSSREKEKRKQKLQAETEAKQKQIDRDRVTALRKQANVEKATSIANIILATALAISKQLAATPLPAGAIFVASQAALGAAQLARAIATPLPQYAKGRGKGKAEFAIVGEAGQEAIVRGDGKVEMTPNAATMTYLNPSDQVISNKDLLMNAAYVKLAGQGTVTTDKLQVALINEFERNTERLDELIAVTKAKNFSLNNYDLSAYNEYVKSLIR